MHWTRVPQVTLLEIAEVTAILLIIGYAQFAAQSTFHIAEW